MVDAGSEENHRLASLRWCWTISMPFDYAAYPVCLIPLPRLLCLHPSAFYHCCSIHLDVEHHYVYKDAHSHGICLLRLIIFYRSHPFIISLSSPTGGDQGKQKELAVLS